MKVTKNAKIDKNEPMPSICKLCTSMKKHWYVILSDVPQENECFSEKDYSMLPEAVKKEFMEYQPFTNTKRKVLSICKNFSHVRTSTINYK